MAINALCVCVCACKNKKMDLYYLLEIASCLIDNNLY